MSYWIKFEDGSSGCVNQPQGYALPFTADAAMGVAMALTGRRPLSAQSLPYPGGKQLNSPDIPPFCCQPEICAGRNSCQREYACTH